MFVSLRAVNAQFMSMLTELKNKLSEELKCLFMYQNYCSAIRTNNIKNYRWGSLRFFCITNKYIHCIEMYVYCKQICINSIYSTYIFYRSVCPLVVVIHYIQRGFNLLATRKYPVVSMNFLFDSDLHVAFQEPNRGIKQDLPVFKTPKTFCTLFRIRFPAWCFLRLVYIFITGIR
jgi:hypothetical protein